MTLWKLANLTRNAARTQSAVRNPARFARNRAVSKGLGAVGFWRLMRRVWR